MAAASTRPAATPVPPILYGTAWKEDRTEALVRAALKAGFRGIDTANQRRHYHEAGVGAAVKHALASGAVARADLFLQTKFTFLPGQDARLPYDPRAPVAQQVAQSFASSLDHLGVETLDAYVLHGPSARHGLAPEDWEAWAAMEDLQRAGQARQLGVSNVTLDQLAELHARARVKPSIVQNRTLVYPQGDAATRAFSREHGIAYEGFSLLTAAPQLLTRPEATRPAARLGTTPAAVVLRFWVEQGVVVLTGTTSEAHMGDDFGVLGLALADDERVAIARLLGVS
ncbi:MAG: aldo/keto reductase [Halobacteriales archaeon]|nr:aldo/keto reductase [Halobacteriales archaeon]